MPLSLINISGLTVIKEERVVLLAQAEPRKIKLEQGQGSSLFSQELGVQAEIQTYLYMLIQHFVLKEIAHCCKILLGII